MRVRPLLCLAAGAAFLLAGCSAGSAASGGSAIPASAESQKITWATTPVSDDPSAQNPVLALKELLEAETGREVEIVDVPDYTAVLEAIRNGHVDIGLMSGFSSALAVNTGEIDALVAWPGADEPVSSCYVLADSEIRSLDDITPETVSAFADPASSSGYFMPTHLLHEAGLEADTDYTKMFAGGHDMAALAVQNGQAQVGCTASMFFNMYGSPYFPFKEGDVRVIGESISMPVGMAVLGNQSMDAEKRQDIIEAIPSIFSKENADTLGVYSASTVGVEPFIEPDEELFAPLVDIAAVAGVDISDLG